MIQGRKENGYFVTFDGNGNKIEGETRQCVHCQYIWERKFNHSHIGNDQYDEEYIDNKKVTRGYCFKCRGFICCRPECVLTYGLAPTCTTFEEQQKQIVEQLSKHLDVPALNLKKENYEITPAGILIKR